MQVIKMRITGSKVVIRTIEEKDLYNLWKMIYGEENPEWKKWDAPYFPHEHISYEEYVNQMEKRIKSQTQSRFAIEVSEDGQEKVIGTVSYYWEDKRSLWLEMGIVIYDPTYWNGGYGTEALKAWIDYLFSALPLVRVGLTTWSGNQRMIRCAEKLGMKMEGRMRKCRYYNGEYYDSIRMGILREEWG